MLVSIPETLQFRVCQFTSVMSAPNDKNAGLSTTTVKMVIVMQPQTKRDLEVREFSVNVIKVYQYRAW